MNTNKITLTGAPPKIIPAILKGFNIVANHIHLIILPVLLDLLIWLGPRIRVKTLLEPVVAEFYQNMVNFSPGETIDFLAVGKDIWVLALEYLNILGSLRTFPIGIPSLLAGASDLATPLGDASIIELTSIATLAGIWLLLVILGITLGSFYFSEIARVSKEENSRFSFTNTLKQYAQILIFTLIFFVAALVIAIPVSFFISILALISPSLTNFSFIIVITILLWVLLPLAFSPHGIFMFNENIFVSALNSIRMVRFFLPSTGLFLLTLILLNQGLNYLWATPPQTSWLVLIGIFGHAFVSTALIASTFTYYQKGSKWMNDNINKIIKTQTEKSSKEIV